MAEAEVESIWQRQRLAEAEVKKPHGILVLRRVCEKLYSYQNLNCKGSCYLIYPVLARLCVLHLMFTYNRVSLKKIILPKLYWLNILLDHLLK